MRDVILRQDETIGGDDDPRTERTTLTRTLPLLRILNRDDGRQRLSSGGAHALLERRQRGRIATDWSNSSLVACAGERR
jgi:hypothetical protein